MAILSLSPGLATATAVIATLYFVLYRLQLVKFHPDEPPIIASAVPFIGHLLGMAIFGGRYIKGLGIRNPDKPIFTLPVPFSRLYIITSPPLAAAAQRASKTLSFTPLVPAITQRILGLDATTVAIVNSNLDPEPGAPRGFLADMHDMVYASLGPAGAESDLAEMSRAAAVELAEEVGAYAEGLGLGGGDGEGKGRTVDLLVWIRHFVATATARFLYGAENPLAVEPELEGAFWDFDHGLGTLLMGVLPPVTAAHRGRERLVRAFTKYMETGLHCPPADNSDAPKPPSRIIQRRIQIANNYHWTTTATARSEVSFLFAGIVNTATTTFWTILRLFADPTLLATVRAELLSTLTPSSSNSDANTRLLSLDALKNSTPTLTSVIKECLRVGSDNYSVRLVTAPTTLAGTWVLRPGGVVQIAGGVMHADERIWGPDAAEFRAGRFVVGGTGTGAGSSSSSAEKEKESQPGPHPAAFRGFGGGKTLCPGRHFAMNEITAFVAMIVLTFDLEGAGGSGGIQVPEKDDSVMPVHILEPKTPVKVVVKVRDGRKLTIV